MPKNKSDDCMFCLPYPCKCQSSRGQRGQVSPRKTVPPKPVKNLTLPPPEPGPQETLSTTLPTQPSVVLPTPDSSESFKSQSSSLSLPAHDDFAHLYGTQAFVYFQPADKSEEPIEPIVLSGDDADLHNAIRALAPLMSDVDRAKYRDVIDPPLSPGLRKRYKEWKERNAR